MGGGVVAAGGLYLRWSLCSCAALVVARAVREREASPEGACRKSGRRTRASVCGGTIGRRYSLSTVASLRSAEASRDESTHSSTSPEGAVSSKPRATPWVRIAPVAGALKGRLNPTRFPAPLFPLNGGIAVKTGVSRARSWQKQPSTAGAAEGSHSFVLPGTAKGASA
jgi:hypothetical protein